MSILAVSDSPHPSPPTRLPEPSRPPLPSASGHASAAPHPSAGPIRLLVVEDSWIIRERLLRMIEEIPRIDIVGEAEDGFQGRFLFRKHRPDAVVLDIELPGISGLELIAEFKRVHPASVVIILTNYHYKGLGDRCRALGASHFLNKSKDFVHIPEILQRLPLEQNEAP